MFEVSDAYKAAISKQSRSFKLGGEIRLKSGAVIEITDSNVIGELSVSTQMMSGSQYDDVIDIGACTSAALSMTIRDDNSTNSFANARIRLLVGLELEDGTYEYVKMGIFYIDSPTIQRVKNIISFTAYDKMLFLHYLLTDAMRSNMSGMDAYGAAGYLCSLAGIRLQQTHDEVSDFPNGSIALSFADKGMETARDVIMWCGQLMGCFTRINRSGKLEFVQIKAENSDKTGVIIPVRDISASQRFSTKFADEVLRISTLTMKKPDGSIARAYISGTSENKRSLELELEQNPLLTGQTVKSVANALKDMLKVLKTAYFRPFSSKIANDPALDTGDYIRMRGGAIDTSRGYATGMITHSIWRYRGEQDIVNVGTTPVLSPLDDDINSASSFAVTLSIESDNSEENEDISGEEMVYVQPKAQSGKASHIGSSDTAEKLQTTGSKYWAITDGNGVSFGADDSGKIAFLTKQGNGTGFRLGAYGSTGMEFKGSGLGKIRLYDQSDGNCYLYVESGAEFPINICTSDGESGSDHTSIRVSNGGKLKVYPDSLTIQTELRNTLTLKITSDGWSLGTTGKMLEAKSDGLYFNGKKVLLEG